MHPPIRRAGRYARIKPAIAGERQSRRATSCLASPRVVRSLFHLSHAGSRKRGVRIARA
ncbi:hypothetical protein C7S16_3844 [Burkholderia thailandensis]|uniref:Uncharacterized protein n=1 Tax=Burkholderia thailandensis TaxID=57975 RepID=A0AAW9CWW4_BURTH|nr:hypothetical protein [Burkholderia thailandensis]MDW9254637.1 hypothetical protein [Burkholderia thailandensis]